ncbi:MAG: hypothetical protein ACLFV6_16250, partial [Spirulinaceae cyanobacterium]
LTLPMKRESPLLKDGELSATEMEMEAWETFVSEVGGFSAAFPGTPTETIEKASREEGETLDETIVNSGDSGEISFEREELNSIYFVVYQNFPIVEALGQFLSEEEVVAEILAGAVGGIAEDNEILSEREIELDGYQGKEVEVQMPEGYLKTRIYLVNTRLYIVMGGALTQEEAISGGVNRFLDSFTLLE